MSGAAGINPVETAAVLGQFAVDACAEELRQPRRSGDPVSRRRVKQRLDAVLTALTGGDENRKGIASLAREPAQQAYLDELRKSIEDTIDHRETRPAKTTIWKAPSVNCGPSSRHG